MLYQDEVDRAFRVLGADLGYMQNDRDIREWWRVGYICYDEMMDLLDYNRQQFGKHLQMEH